MVKETIRVVLADDHPFMRAGIRATLSGEDDIVVVGEAADGDQAQRLCLQLKPDVLLLDMQMSGPPATATVAFLRERCPQVKVLVLTAYDDDVYVQGMLAIGVAGYVLKDDVPEALVRALRAVMRGDTWFSGRVLRNLALKRESSAFQGEGTRLSGRELEIVQLLAAGMADKEIGDALYVSERTVRYHLRAIYDKLGVKSRVAAAVRATQLGLVQRTGEGRPPALSEAPVSGGDS